MNTAPAYLNFRGDLPFWYSPFNDNDAVLLSILTSVDFGDMITEEMTLSRLALKYKNTAIPDKRDSLFNEKAHLLYMMGSSKRFSNVKIADYVKDIDYVNEKTFYGVVFHINPFFDCIVFRGTDGTLISWKENFNTLFESPTAGQSEAARYLKNHLGSAFKKYYVIGHSKGGNLAIYSSINQDKKLIKRIKRIIVFDAPGFLDDITKNESYDLIKERLTTYVPKHCIVGNLLNPPFDKKYVNCVGKEVYQHDLFNWLLDTLSPSLTEPAPNLNDNLAAKLNAWVYSIPVEERKEVIDELFSVFTKNGIDHIYNLLHLDLKRTIGIIMSATKFSSETRDFLSIIFKELKS